MSLENIVRSVSGRLSLRKPQATSLRRLHWAVDAVPALRNAKARSAEELTHVRCQSHCVNACGIEK